jgi:hypothetical protein
MSILSYRIVTARTMSRVSILPYRCVTARTMHIHSTRGWYLLGRSNMTNHDRILTIRHNPCVQPYFGHSRCVTEITMHITFTWWLILPRNIEYDNHDRILTFSAYSVVQPYLQDSSRCVTENTLNILSVVDNSLEHRIWWGRYSKRAFHYSCRIWPLFASFWRRRTDMIYYSTNYSRSAIVYVFPLATRKLVGQATAGHYFLSFRPPVRYYFVKILDKVIVKHLREVNQPGEVRQSDPTQVKAKPPRKLISQGPPGYYFLSPPNPTKTGRRCKTHPNPTKTGRSCESNRTRRRCNIWQYWRRRNGQITPKRIVIAAPIGKLMPAMTYEYISTHICMPARTYMITHTYEYISVHSDSKSNPM